MKEAAEAATAPQAARPERLHRLKMAALAVFGDVSWRVLDVLPWTWFIVLGAIWFGQPWMYAVAAAAVLILLWSFSPNQRLEGEEVTRAQAPELFAQLDALRQATASPPVHRVLIDDALNASAALTGVTWLPWTGRRTLILGLPLLATLSPRQASAVIGHELGHLSLRHGRLGHWVYGTRRGWLAYVVEDGADATLLHRAAASFARWFVPYFSEYAFSFSRQCEYEADADAARAVAPRDLVQALVQLRSVGRRWGDGLRLQTVDWNRHEPQAPGDWWHRLQALALNRAPQAESLDAEWSRPPSRHDTHPTLAARAAALGVERDDALPPDLDPMHCAGARWLGNHWPQRMASANARWRREHSRGWRGNHVQLAAIAQREDSMSRGDGPSLERARLVELLGRPGSALEDLERLHAQGDASAAVMFHLERLRLAQGTGDPASAVSALESLVKQRPTCAAAVRDLLGRWWQQHGAATQEQERRNAVLRQRALQRQAQAQSMAHEHIEKSSLQAPALPAHALAAIEAVCRDDEMVRRAWMGLCACQVDAKYEFTVHVLVLQVDPQPMRRADLDEDQLVQAYANDVALWLTQPDELVLVRVCFTTELALPPTLDASNARQWTRR